MNQVQNPADRSLLFWAVMPERLLTHGIRYVFGHPVPFVVVFSVLAAVLFYLSALPGPAGEDGHVTIGEGNPIPGASTIATFLLMLVGILLIWMSQHGPDRPNTVWTKAPSIWRPVGEAITVAPDDESIAAAEMTGGSGGDIR
ncbi:MAG: hypothetical protein IRY87_24070 [Acetobacteraceae bacterium]|nr:hypothetical protein [Acetobacteraceae bacterium]